LSRKKKAPVYGIKIDAYAAEGKSIAHLEDGRVLFVENVIPGDIVNVLITKKKRLGQKVG
jgi:23S rRNA (uracil1939-C5)-methyltransferase